MLHSANCRTVALNGNDKAPIAPPKVQFIMKYSPGLPKDAML